MSWSAIVKGLPDLTHRILQTLDHSIDDVVRLHTCPYYTQTTMRDVGALLP